jgi:RHS repeat-associated protein
VANYTNNILNQITSRDVPGYVDIMGDALATSSVTVNGLSPYRKVEYFRQQLAVTNTGLPVWQSVTVTNTTSSNQSVVMGNAYVARTPENCTYDADGNLLSDGRWNYTWDAENRLINMTSLGNTPTNSQLKLAYVYDYQGRRISKTVSTLNGSAYAPSYTNYYVYDGWNCIATLNPAHALLNTFLWGTDLSGSMQGAGGVGGLIEATYYGTATTSCFAAFDGNGNVSALINAADGTTAAQYEYGPFGEVIRATGPMAKVNPFRFSTKYQDDETDLLYYGYRYYNAGTGRWPSRDPIGEPGFELVCGRPKTSVEQATDRLRSALKVLESKEPSLAAKVKEHLLKDGTLSLNYREDSNLYAFLNNAPLNQFDVLGLMYDSATCYFINCTKLLTAASRCACMCAPVTTGPDDSQKCQTKCEKCDALFKGMANKKLAAEDICLCYCSLVNLKRHENGQAPLDCAAVCGLLKGD